MSKFEYKLEFESDINDMPVILRKITEIIRAALLNSIINVMPTITILEE
jgi:hypothetical protein